MTKALYFLSLGWITILFLSNNPIAAQNNWFEKAKDGVDGRFSQGVATDGVFWYFSSRGGLYKTDANFNMLIEKDGTQNPIPGFLQDQGYNHIGDIAYFVGKLYAPIEDVSYVKPIIGIYDADSLNFTGDFVQVPQSHFPWIAVDPRTGYFYSSEFNGVNKLYVYELYVWDGDKYFDLIDEVTLNLTLSRVQGGAFLGDFLYLACDNGDYVYEVEIASGTVNPVFNVPSGPEMEGIEAYELDSGVLHFVAETGDSTNIFYHYDNRLFAPEISDVPTSFVLEQNYPNPFNPRTTIRFALPEDQHVTLTVYNLLGQIIIEPMNDQPYDAGIHTITLDTGHFSSGVYFYRIQAGKWSATRKMILMK